MLLVKTASQAIHVLSPFISILFVVSNQELYSEFYVLPYFLS